MMRTGLIVDCQCGTNAIDPQVKKQLSIIGLVVLISKRKYCLAIFADVNKFHVPDFFAEW